MNAATVRARGIAVVGAFVCAIRVVVRRARLATPDNRHVELLERVMSRLSEFLSR